MSQKKRNESIPGLEGRLFEALQWACRVSNIQKIRENCSDEEFEQCQVDCAAANKLNPNGVYNRNKVDCRIRLALAHVGLTVQDVQK